MTIFILIALLIISLGGNVFLFKERKTIDGKLQQCIAAYKSRGSKLKKYEDELKKRQKTLEVMNDEIENLKKSDIEKAVELEQLDKIKIELVRASSEIKTLTRLNTNLKKELTYKGVEG